MRDGAYFSDIEMRHREPLLYERMIGQFQSQVRLHTFLPLFVVDAFMSFEHGELLTNLQGDITRHLYGGDRSNATLSDIFLEIFDDKQVRIEVITSVIYTLKNISLV